MKIFVLLFSVVISSTCFADDHSSGSAGKGAFSTLMVQVSDVDTYIKVLKSNDGPFKTVGSVAAGYCLTRSGNDYPGQMFVWNAFDSVSDAMAGVLKYDPYKAPKAFAALREVKYSAIFKPLNDFKLDPGIERLWRVAVPAENLSKFVEGVVEVESALRAKGYDLNMGVFMALAGGAVETKTLHVRAAARDGATLGKVVDEYFENAPWSASWNRTIALASSIETDTIEECEQVYSAN
jgi:hypothetical protein